VVRRDVRRFDTQEETEFLRRHLGPGGGQICLCRAGWASHGSGDGSGLGGRVGFHHKTLASLLGAVAGAGLNIREVREFAGGGVVVPRNLGLVADKA
jgi:hypothetical protein